MKDQCQKNGERFKDLFDKNGPVFKKHFNLPSHAGAAKFMKIHQNVDLIKRLFDGQTERIGCNVSKLYKIVTYHSSNNLNALHEKFMEELDSKPIKEAELEIKEEEEELCIVCRIEPATVTSIPCGCRRLCGTGCADKWFENISILCPWCRDRKKNVQLKK